MKNNFVVKQYLSDKKMKIRHNYLSEQFKNSKKIFKLINDTVKFNDFTLGRQVDSFESEIEVSGLDEPFPSVFIRAPIVESIGEGVEVYARVDEKIVLCGTDSILVASFHPELSNDGRIHEMFLSLEPSGS